MTSRTIPREKIPWYPAVDEGRCNGCKICYEFCRQGVYAWDAGGNVARVDRPFDCIVGCSGCQGLCPVGAIAFPDIEEINEVIRKLRNQASS